MLTSYSVIRSVIEIELLFLEVRPKHLPFQKSLNVVFWTHFLEALILKGTGNVQQVIV